MSAWDGPIFRKREELPGATRLEAQGLAWLAEPMSDGGALVVPTRTGDGWLEEPRLPQTAVTAQAAEDFGRALAVTHAAGAPAFGAAPPGWDGRTQMGRCNIRLRPHQAGQPGQVEEPEQVGQTGQAEQPGQVGEPGQAEGRSWGEFYAADRVGCYIGPARDRGVLSPAQARLLERVCERLAAGDFSSPQPALVEQQAVGTAVARTHGDLWCGNVLWVPVTAVSAWAPAHAGQGPGPKQAAPIPPEPVTGGRHGVVGVLIDPLAHGAHAETDLAALGVFGQPHLGRILAAYHEVSPLAEGWPERAALHQLHLVMIHVHLFGGGYALQAADIARRYV